MNALVRGVVMFPAHILKKDGEPDKLQTVEQHCRGCAAAAAALAGEELRQTAYLAGLLHDFGKYTAAFRSYIQQAAEGKPVRRGSVNHTFAGVRFALERWHTAPKQSLENLAAELIAIAIGGHHGLFDTFDPRGIDGFAHRAKKEDIHYEEAKENYLAQCASLCELDALFQQAVAELSAAANRARSGCENFEDFCFRLSLLARRLSSVVIDADRRDTAEFMAEKTLFTAQPNLDMLWQSWLGNVEETLDAMQEEGAIAAARRTFSAQCRDAAMRGGGILTLGLPTGAGKTLASLRYALRAAQVQQKKRILFVIPLLSVLDQNARVIREAVGEDGYILEHHSNIVHEEGASEYLDRRELLTETWDAPMIITTLVQLLNTLFSGKTSCVRRMSALAESVIVIDEVQSVPTRLLALFTEAMNYLAAAAGATIVLCSATQPGWEYMNHPLQWKDQREIVPYDAKLWEVFRRTELCAVETPFTLETLGEFATQRLEEEESLLLICNTKKEAAELYTHLRSDTDAACFHLSTSMCMAHRMETLRNIQACLDSKMRVVCVATQLVEAGVDFSFACVIRIAAGLDNAIQAAGRCNRSGEFGRICKVYIVRLIAEKLSHLPEIFQSQAALSGLLEAYQKAPQTYERSLTSARSISEYYQRLYVNQNADAQEFPLPKLGTTMYKLLGCNAGFWSKCQGEKGHYYMRQAFQTAGAHFEVFETHTIDVLVPYGGGAEIIADLQSERALWDVKYCMMILEKAKRYSISLYEYEIRTLREQDALLSVQEGLTFALREGYYSQESGFSAAGDKFEFTGV